MDWFPHHIEAYDTDTLHLTLAQDGAYHRLLRWYYDKERALPADDISLAAIARIGIEEWLPMSPIIRAFFETRVSRVTNAATLHQKRANAYILEKNAKRRDGKARQEKFRKTNMMGTDYDVSRVTNAADRNTRGRVETLSPSTPTEIPITSEPRGEGGAGGSAEADRPAARHDAPPVTGGPTPKPKAPRKPKTIRTRLPETWEPSPTQRSYAHVAGLEDPKIDFIAVGFLRYWTGPDCKNPVKADWDRTWENWIDREIANGALRSNGRVGSAGYRPEPDSGLASFLRRNLGADCEPGVSPGRGIDPEFSGVAPVRPSVKPGPIRGFDAGETILEPDAETGTYHAARNPPGDHQGEN